MFFELTETNEKKLARHEETLKKLQQRQKEIESEIAQFYAEHGIDLKDLANQMQQLHNFPPELQEEVQRQRTLLAKEGFSFSSDTTQEKEIKPSLFSLFKK
jgi:chromosome segregation ATPase